MIQLISGESAFAYGAINSGVRLITGYPGSPSSGAFELLRNLQIKFGYHMEWSLNEKVACEVAIGGSIGGLRSLICTKSVGLNVMIDPLMALNLTPLNAGLVILLGDDPQGYGSQNDQDSRAIVHFLEMPLWEPAAPADGYFMMINAFQVSEEFGVPVIIRETRSFSQVTGEIDFELKYDPEKKELIEEPFRFVPVPENAVAKHLALQKSLSKVTIWHENSVFNETTGNGKKGILASGFVTHKLLDILEGAEKHPFRIFKLGTLFPLPYRKIEEFLNDCDEILIFEESSDFIERAIKVIAWETHCATTILGKSELGLSPAGELFKWQISNALNTLFPDLKIKVYLESAQAEEYPEMKNNCSDSRYEEVIELVERAAQLGGLTPLFVGDPGCIFMAGEKLIAKYAIGSAVGLASGLQYANPDKPVVAFVGDSGFFHTTMPAIANAAFTLRNFLIIVLDNGGALTTGLQPTPAGGKNILNQESMPQSFQKIAESLGIQQVSKISLNEEPDKIINAFLAGLTGKKLNLIIVQIPSTTAG
jgi:indolepyruvate ferredoxin oxidoreductase alpha subunit